MKTAPKRRSLAPAVDIRVASPLWQAQPLAEQTVRDAIAAAATMISKPSPMASAASRRASPAAAVSLSVASLPMSSK